MNNDNPNFDFTPFSNGPKPPMKLLHYACLRRKQTGSVIDYELPGPGLPNLYQVRKLIRRKMPGWEVIEATPGDADEP